MNAPPPGRPRLVIVGATGMVGGYALDHPAVGSVSAIERLIQSVLLNKRLPNTSTAIRAASNQTAMAICPGRRVQMSGTLNTETAKC
jgi:hypothetical protein